MKTDKTLLAIITIILTLITLVPSYGAISDDLLFWYGAEGANSSIDATGRQQILSSTVPTTTIGCLSGSKCYNATGSGSGENTIPISNYVANSNKQYTVSFWTKFNNDLSGTDQEPSGFHDAGADTRMYFYKTAGFLVGYTDTASTIYYYNANKANFVQGWVHWTFASTSNNISIYVNGSLVASSNSTVGQMASSTPYNWSLFATFTGANDYLGLMDEIAFWNRSLNSSEISCIANSSVTYSTLNSTCGTGAAPINYDNFTTPSAYTRTFNTTINIGPTWITTATQTVNYTETAQTYIGASITVNSTVGAATTQCRIGVNGTYYNSTETRSLTSGTTGNIYLQTTNITVNAGTYQVTTECQKTSGTNYEVTATTIMGVHLYDDTAARQINYNYTEPSTITLGGTAVELYKQNFYTNAQTINTNNISIVVDWRASTTYTSTGNNTIYLNISGETSQNYTRYGTSGSTGSIGGVYLIRNATNATWYNISYYGKGAGTISDLKVHTYQLESEPNATHYEKKTTSIGTTLTNLTTINVSSTKGGTYEVLVIAGINNYNTNATNTIGHYKVTNGTKTSQEYLRTYPAQLGSTVQRGNLKITESFKGSGTGNTSITLQGYCEVAGCITEYDLVVIILDTEITNEDDTYTITAYNLYDNTSINTFNVTIDSATVTTTNGTITLPKGGTYTINITANEYYENSTTHNTSTGNLNMSVAKWSRTSYQGSISGSTYTPICTLNGTSVTTTAATQQPTWTNYTTYITCEASTYYDQTNFTITHTQENWTLNLTEFSVTMNFYNITNMIQRVNTTGFISKIANNATDTIGNVSYFFNTSIISVKSGLIEGKTTITWGYQNHTQAPYTWLSNNTGFFEYYNTHAEYERVNVDIAVMPETRDLKEIEILVTDKLTRQPVEDVYVRIRSRDYMNSTTSSSSEYTYLIGQRLTGSDGIAKFWISYGLHSTVYVSKNGYGAKSEILGETEGITTPKEIQIEGSSNTVNSQNSIVCPRRYSNYTAEKYLGGVLQCQWYVSSEVIERRRLEGIIITNNITFEVTTNERIAAGLANRTMTKFTVLPGSAIFGGNVLLYEGTDYTTGNNINLTFWLSGVNIANRSIKYYEENRILTSEQFERTLNDRELRPILLIGIIIIAGAAGIATGMNIGYPIFMGLILILPLLVSGMIIPSILVGVEIAGAVIRRVIKE